MNAVADLTQRMQEACEVSDDMKYGTIGTSQVREWIAEIRATCKESLQVADGKCPMCDAPVKVWPDYRDGRGTDYEYAPQRSDDYLRDKAAVAGVIEALEAVLTYVIDDEQAQESPTVSMARAALARVGAGE